MITSGAQIRAGRAMLGLRVEDLATAAAVNVNTVRYWEARDTIKRECEPWALRAMRQAFARRGLEVFSDPEPGVRLCKRLTLPIGSIGNQPVEARA